jgi:prepilin-type N-terminal cleavage/methylation domain-containing protein
MAGRINRRGLTLTEMLVVIAIIGILASLLIPAVQYARETARKSSCANSLRQIGTAFQLHNTSFQYFPTAGSVDPAPRLKGTGGTIKNAKTQSWGWAYQILPYLEQEPAYKEPSDLITASTVVPTYFCSSRRKPIALSQQSADSWGPQGDRGQLDYAGCAGWLMAPAAFPDAANGPLHHNGVVIPHIRVNTSTGAVTTFDTDWVGLGNLKDGASNTLLVGERRWNYAREEDASQLDEDNGFIAGYDWDTIRWAYEAPAYDNDDPSGNGDTRFGSAHAGVCQFVFADGSVHSVSYQVSIAVFRQVAGRKDGAADLTQLQ